MSRRLLLFIICSIVGIVSIEAALAQAADAGGILNNIDAQYQSAGKTWGANIQGVARSLFLKLAMIEFVASGILWAVAGQEMQSLIAAMAKKIMGIGFFFAILLYADTWLPAIIDSFKMAANIASDGKATSATVTPSGLFDIGMDAAGAISDGLKDASLLDQLGMAIPIAFCYLLVIVAFAVIAGQLIITQIESYIVIGAGALMLGFGGSRWTQDMAQKYISSAVSTGVKLFLIYLLCALGQTLTAGWAAEIAASVQEASLPTAAMEVAGGAIVFMFLALQVPSLAASLMSGSPALTAGAMMGTAMGVAGSAAGAAGKALTSGRGLAQAVAAGYGAHRSGGGSVMGSLAKGTGTAMKDMGKEAGRTVGRAIGVTPPTASRSQTVGGRAAETRRYSTQEGNLPGQKPGGKDSGGSAAGGASTTSGATGATGGNDVSGGSAGSGAAGVAGSTAGSQNGSDGGSAGAAGAGGGGSSSSDASTSRIGRGDVGGGPSAGAVDIGSQAGASDGGSRSSMVGDSPNRDRGRMVDTGPTAGQSAEAGSTAGGGGGTAGAKSAFDVKPMPLEDFQRRQGDERPIFDKAKDVRPPQWLNDGAPSASVQLRGGHSEE